MTFFEKSLRILALFCAAALTPVAGCQGGASRQNVGRQSEAPPPPAQAPVPEVHVLVDEAMLKKPHAILGGTVENIGAERLESVSVELELRRREDGAIELRAVPVSPPSLAPGEKGRYSLRVLSDEWSGSRLLRVRSGSREGEVAFKSSPGARRPPEKVPESRTATATNPPSRPRPAGEEFINTPDTPVSVP